MEKRKNTIFLLSFSIVWAIIIFVLCTMPQRDLPQIKIPNIDKIAHFGCFLILSVFLSLLFHFKTRSSYLCIVLFSTLLAFIYGGSIEIMQSRFFNRTGDVKDLIADVLGGFVGALMYPAVLRLYLWAFGKKND